MYLFCPLSSLRILKIEERDKQPKEQGKPYLFMSCFLTAARMLFQGSMGGMLCSREGEVFAFLKRLG